jgi:hypothetical protein
MTEGYPPQWQQDVQSGSAPIGGYTGAGAHEAGTTVGYDTSASQSFDAPVTSGGSDQGKAGAAKEQAAAVGQGAADAGQQVASVAKDQAQNVVSEAGSQTKNLIGQARTELTDQANTQQQRLAQGLHSLGDELHAMTQHSESPGVATDLARQAATRTHDVASWLESREPGSLVTELQSFARQRPGAFLAIAAGAGLLVGRLGRGVKDAGSDDSSAQVDGGVPASSVPISDGSYADASYSDASYYGSGSAGTVTHGSDGIESAQDYRPFSSSQDAGFQTYSTNESGL